MKMEITTYEKDKHDTTISTQADDKLEPEYYIDEGWEVNNEIIHKGFRFRIEDPRHYGRCIPFLYFDGEPLCLLGPDLIFSIGLLAAIVLLLRSFESALIRPKYPNLSYAVYVGAQTLFITTYLALILKNPGAKSQHQSVEYVEETLVCSKCNTVASPYVVHCDRCDLCFEGFDHHCVWASKCIAQGNQTEFKLFASVGGIILLYSLFMALTAVV